MLGGASVKSWNEGSSRNGVERSNVPRDCFCRGAKTNSKVTNCACRYLMFHENDYFRLVPVLKEIQELRLVLENEMDSVRAQECFNAVFGITNISTYGGSSGTRGLFFYFNARCGGVNSTPRRASLPEDSPAV